MSSSFSDRLAQVLMARCRAVTHPEPEAAPAVPRPGLTIALSREAGTNASSLAREIGKRLGWEVYDRELLERIAGEMGLRANLLEAVDERRVSWFLAQVQSWGGVPTVTEGAYVQHLIEVILSLGSKGECVIVGRGAPHILPPQTTLAVRLVAPLARRIELVQARRQVSADEAARWITETDRMREAFVHEHFHKDTTDVHNYDLVLNQGRFSIEECADIVVGAVRVLQSHPGRVQAGSPA
jgi:cytidylate kinase